MTVQKGGRKASTHQELIQTIKANDLYAQISEAFAHAQKYINTCLRWKSSIPEDKQKK